MGGLGRAWGSEDVFSSAPVILNVILVIWGFYGRKDYGNPEA